MKSNSHNPYSAPQSSVGDSFLTISGRFGIVIGCLFALPLAAFVAYLVYFSILRGQIGVLPNYFIFVVPLGLIVYFGVWWQKYGLELDRMRFLGAMMWQGMVLVLSVLGAVLIGLFITDGKWYRFTHRDINPTLIGFVGFSIWMALLGIAVRTAAKRYQKKA